MPPVRYQLVKSCEVTFTQKSVLLEELGLKRDKKNISFQLVGFHSQCLLIFT